MTTLLGGRISSPRGAFIPNKKHLPSVPQDRRRTCPDMDLALAIPSRVIGVRMVSQNLLRPGACTSVSRVPGGRSKLTGASPSYPYVTAR
jgi:hypothetical protein